MADKIIALWERRTPPSPGLRIDYRAMCAYVDARDLRLSPGRFAILCKLVEADGGVVTHRAIAEAVAGHELADWYSNELAANRSRNEIYYLRHRIGSDYPIREVRGIGYRLEKPCS